MIQIKINGATPKSGASICKTCKYGRVVRGQNCEEIIICEGGLFGDGGIVRFKVSECAKYHPSNMPWLYEMKEMAWKIEARKRGPVGFEPETSDMEVVVTPPKRNTDDDELPDF